MSQTEQQSVLRDVYDVCKIYNTKCNIDVFDSKSYYAYSNNKNQIRISSEIMNNFTIDKGRAVLYHEVSHLILKHPQTWESIVKSPKFKDTNYIVTLRHNQEFQADTFASFLLWSRQHNNQLDYVLMDITPANTRDYSTRSHPSINSRIYNIQRLKKIYPANYKGGLNEPIKTFN